MESVEGEEALANQIRAIKTDECSEATRTSANKKKSLGTDEWTELSTALLASHERHLEQFGTEEGSVPMATLCFLSATETTGMRPSEWWGTVMEMESDETEPGVVLDTIVLTVKNGKASNGRANGQNRTLRLRGLTEEKKLALLRHYRSVKQLSSEADFERYQKSCTSCMTYTTSKLWPTRKRKPSLYSGRHQVSANLKKDRVPLDVLAAIMGHATDRTATEHYGRRKYGRGNESMIEADPDDVSRVRQVAGERTAPDFPGRIGAGSNGPKMG
ncbi:site-specific integrase [Marinobacterium stanieri]|nr:site-specific integrase [Marinobacterium stanieri]